MPNELPAFLQEFIKHRHHTKKETPHDAKHTGLTPASKTKDLDTTIKGIIEKKPTRKTIDVFLQKRCDELSATKTK